MDPLELETELTGPTALVADGLTMLTGKVPSSSMTHRWRRSSADTSATATAPRRGRPLTLRRALVVSGSPDQLNANAGLRPYVVDGLREALPEAMALGVPYELGVAAVTQWQPQLVIVFRQRDDGHQRLRRAGAGLSSAGQPAGVLAARRPV
jgi:hypothetical protein